MDLFSGFIHTEGRFLKDENGKEYLLKGMAFGNNVWDNPSEPPYDVHHTCDSYRELSEMGFNSVRFYLNYGLFEDDDNPYVYKESGFEWIDNNIKWARESGMRLVLNMHFPQGGYQSQGDGTALWYDSENQNRLCMLWKEIARRYKDEPCIVGYGLLNEPVVPTDDVWAGSRKWADLLSKMIDAVRGEDRNHIIFIEKILTFQNAETNELEWGLSNDENNFALSDDNFNVVYEFHFYNPFTFTHQGLSWSNTSEFNKIYPNEEDIFADGVSWHKGSFNGGSCDTELREWQYLESDLVTVTGDDQILSYVFQARELGENGSVYVDDIAITEYDAEGNRTRIIYASTFDKTCSMYFWANNNIGSGEYISHKGRERGGSYLVSGTTDDASGTIGYFRPVKNYSYQASGYFRVRSSNEQATIRPRVDIWKAQSISFLNKEFLEKNIRVYVDFSEKFNVPVYCGEFGTGTSSFFEDRGGERWVSDVIDIFNEHRISYNYHTYHEESFGLYMNSPNQPAAERNNALYEVLSRKNKESDI